MSSDKELNFLAINTAGKNVEVALNYNNNQTLVSDTEQKKASEALLTMIDAALKEQNADLESLDFIAVSVGPGSFTGIRIGLVTARTLCQALDKKLLPLTYPEILSYNIQSGQKNIFTLSDAGNSLFYAAKFNAAHEVLTAPHCIRESEIRGLLSEEKDAIVAECAGMYESQNVTVHAGAAALLNAAKEKYRKTDAGKYNLVEPLYVRQPQAVSDLEKAAKL